jgi:pyridoxamine 5'-phosphate oxidase
MEGMSTPSDRREAVSSSPSVIGQIDPVFSRQRVAYDVEGLDADQLASGPLAQFRRWYDDALAARLTEPNAMTLATVDHSGAPTARTVLLKHADRDGFVFFTNYRSRKGTELAANPVAALVIAWLPLHRQVGVRGRVEPVSAAATAEYFGSRPWGSRIGAWASHQSQVVATREELERRWAELAERWPDQGRADDVPVPPHWGGYVVRPFEVEFWQGRSSRMHDRLVFLPAEQPLPAILPTLDDDSAWRIERREP